MATKSQNTQGNPWHDEDGKFTSKTGGVVDNTENAEFDVDNPDAFLSSFDADNPDDFLSSFEEEQPKQPKLVEYKIASSVEEAEEIANAILGKEAAFYDKLDLEYANQINKCLYNVHQKYPKIFEKFNYIGNTPEVLLKCENMIVKTMPNQYYAKVVSDNFKHISWGKKTGYGTGAITVYSALTGDQGIVLNPYNKNVTMGCDFSGQIHKHIKLEEKRLYPIYHELGHVCSNFLKQNGKIGEMMSFRKIVLGLYKLSDHEFTKYAAVGGKDEFFSEAFADVMCFGDKARPRNKQAVELWEELYDEITK